MEVFSAYQAGKNIYDTWEKIAEIRNTQKSLRNQWGNCFLRSIGNWPKKKTGGRNVIITWCLASLIKKEIEIEIDTLNL